MVLLIVVTALGGVALVIAVGCVIAARLRSQAELNRAAAVQAAVDTVISVASDKLGDHMTAGSSQLDLRQQAFEQRVADVSRELGSIRDLVGRLQQDAASQHGAVVQNLQDVAQASAALTQTTQHLRQALAGPKQRGQWGERMAEDVLRAAGFQEGVSYRRQRALESGSVPDFAFLLPGDLEVRMDVKFPIDNYLRVLEADSDVDRGRCTKAFVRDVRDRIRELARRDYVDGRDTVDVVLLFIPNEAVYAFLHEADPSLLDEALSRKVVLCSPATLFAVLAVIRQAVDHFHLERTSDEILRCLGGVSDEWDRFTAHLDTVGSRLETLNKGFAELQGPRRRQLERKLGEIDRLRTIGSDGPADPGEGRPAGPVQAVTIHAADPPRDAARHAG